jgi:hypothetical protein
MIAGEITHPKPRENMRKASSVLAAVVMSAIASITGGAPAQAAVTPGEYVALGDSFASGVGACLPVHRGERGL